MRSEPIQIVLNGLRRRPVLEVTLACLAVLLLAQALIGALSLSALNRLVVDTTADRVEVVARRVAGNIENGLRLGKPLEQYFGLRDTLRDGLAGSRGVQGAAVLLADGQALATQGELPEDAARLVRTLDAGHAAITAGAARRASGALVAVADDRVTVAVPLTAAGARLWGPWCCRPSRTARPAAACWSITCRCCWSLPCWWAWAWPRFSSTSCR